MARAGRRPGDNDTRGEVLAAARATFAERGYHGATIRAIAATADVDPALVHHYFGTKEDLFAAAVRLPMPPAAFAERIIGPGVDGAGERLAAAFFEVWEDPTTRDGLLTMLRGAFATDRGAAVLRDFFGTVMVRRLAGELDGEGAELRMTLAASHLIGIAVLRYVVRFPDLEAASVDDLVALVGPRLQAYLG
ncbi:TetR family transcriptional regulator [Salsipaludibacter albus]|uniref:TetR/AcrR family transcriptional regulator n=1 Tax=Salsipaludibacter albus TaxID=2849650 RepID=UPI001EE3E7A3|nr:TetR family transcriptional regulator [Salsipaludibacter albus]MBY5161872.1 TetR family transcriptional regulator [Salsipaludibacter albus]